MRSAALLLVWVISSAIQAQPDEWREHLRNPCGFAPNDSIDITNDGVLDVVVQGVSSGTDDEPSSSGHCALHVMNLPGTVLLHERDAQGNWHMKVCAKGDSIHAVEAGPRDDFRIPLEMYTDGFVPVVQWGYGHQAAPASIAPGLASQRYVFQTMAHGNAWHGSFTIEVDATGQVSIRMGALAPADRSFAVK